MQEGLKYAYLREEQTYPIVISSTLLNDQERKLLYVFKKHKKAIGWTLNDIKGINPLICTHRINLEENLNCLMWELSTLFLIVSG